MAQGCAPTQLLPPLLDEQVEDDDVVGEEEENVGCNEGNEFDVPIYEVLTVQQHKVNAKSRSR